MTENEVLEICNQNNDQIDRIKKQGMTLEELQQMCTKVFEKSQSLYGSEIVDSQDMKKQLICAFENKKYVICNFLLMAENGGCGYGHFSPIVGYDKEEDRFLIVDTWWHTESFWIKTELLY